MLVGEAEGKWLFGVRSVDFEDNSKVIRCESVDWINVAQDSDYKRAVSNTIKGREIS
jgi:hypothetical protein